MTTPVFMMAKLGNAEAKIGRSSRFWQKLGRFKCYFVLTKYSVRLNSRDSFKLCDSFKFVTRNFCEFFTERLRKFCRKSLKIQEFEKKKLELVHADKRPKDRHKIDKSVRNHQIGEIFSQKIGTSALE